MLFKDFEYIDPDLRKSIVSHGFEKAFPIQESVLSLIQAERVAKIRPILSDICLCAPTGSGKTLSYALLLNELLKNPPQENIAAIILAPTSELVAQTYNELSSLFSGVGLSFIAFSIGKSLENEAKQFTRDSTGKLAHNVIISTPQRLSDHLISHRPEANIFYGKISEKIIPENLDLSQLKYLILDETDRLVKMANFNHVMEHIYEFVPFASSSHLPLNKVTSNLCRKILVSATPLTNPAALAFLHLRKPKVLLPGNRLVNFENQDTEAMESVRKRTEELEEEFLFVDAKMKINVVASLLESPDRSSELLSDTFSGHPLLPALIVAKNSLEAHKTLRYLEACLPALKFGELSSTVSKSRRMHLIDSTRANQIDVLVTCDAMLRGLDILSLNSVIHLSSPEKEQDFIQRSGRVARAQQIGVSVVLIDPEADKSFMKIVCKTHPEIDASTEKTRFQTAFNVSDLTFLQNEDLSFDAEKAEQTLKKALTAEYHDDKLYTVHLSKLNLQ